MGNNLDPPKSVIGTEPFPPRLLPQTGETHVNGGRRSSSIEDARPSGETPATFSVRRSEGRTPCIGQGRLIRQPPLQIAPTVARRVSRHVTRVKPTHSANRGSLWRGDEEGGRKRPSHRMGKISCTAVEARYNFPLVHAVSVVAVFERSRCFDGSFGLPLKTAEQFWMHSWIERVSPLQLSPMIGPAIG